MTTPARRDKCLFGQFQVSASAHEFPLENEVSLGIPRQADPKIHRGVAGLRFREVSENSDTVSPSLSSDSTSARNSGSTRTDGMVAVFMFTTVAHLRCMYFV